MTRRLEKENELNNDIINAVRATLLNGSLIYFNTIKLSMRMKIIPLHGKG